MDHTQRFPHQNDGPCPTRHIRARPWLNPPTTQNGPHRRQTAQGRPSPPTHPRLPTLYALGDPHAPPHHHTRLLLRLTFHHDPITKWELTIRSDLIWLRLYNKDKLSELSDPLPASPTPRELQFWLDLARDHKGAWRAPHTPRHPQRMSRRRGRRPAAPATHHPQRRAAATTGPNAHPPGWMPAIHPIRHDAICA